jgi:hypothetical protein
LRYSKGIREVWVHPVNKKRKAGDMMIVSWMEELQQPEIRPTVVK